MWIYPHSDGGSGNTLPHRNKHRPGHRGNHHRGSPLLVFYPQYQAGEQAPYLGRRFPGREPVGGFKRGAACKRHTPRKYRRGRPDKVTGRQCRGTALLELVRLQQPRGMVRLFRFMVLQSSREKRAALCRVLVTGRTVVPVTGTMGRKGL